MAKKAQAIQLQAEVNNDEDWEKLLQRDGLLVVDVFSEWCGPCSGMTATLKKLKLEIGGDVLHLAIAKSDKITALERFRNKSEPTWMFVVNGKMVNFMFGANAPKLTRLITEELRKEVEARQGRRERVQNEINELADEEKERMEIVEQQQQAAREKERAKAAKELYERRTAECHNILETLQHLGIILIFPHARPAYQEAFGDLLGEAGLTISQTDKFDLTEELLDELFFFGDNPFDDEAMEELLNNTSVFLLIKPIPARDVTEPTDDLINEIVYGPSKKAPGSPDSVARHLAKVHPQTEEEPHEKLPDRIAIWAPENELIKATGLRLFFTKYTEHYLIPEPEPIPPHYAVVFDAIRRSEIADVIEKYPEQVLRYGFFTSEVPEEAQLVAKSIKKYERSSERAPNQKMVIQLSKRKSECVLAFAQLKPFYISSNAKEGERECKMFFPDDYDEPPEEEEEEVKPPVPATPSIVAEQEFEGEEAEGEAEEGAEAAPEDMTSQVPGEEASQVVPPETESQVVPPETESQVVPGETGEAPPEAAVAAEGGGGEEAPAEGVPEGAPPAEEAPPESPPVVEQQEEGPAEQSESPDTSDLSPKTETTTDVTDTTEEESPA